MSIQSEFFKDLSKYEAPYVGGFTKRQLKMGLQLIPGIILIFLEASFLETWVFTITSIPTGILFIAPPVLKGLGKWQTFKKDIDFFIKWQDRTYQSGTIRRYEPHEFIQKKRIKETDEI